MSSTAGTPNSLASDAMCPVVAPMSVTMAAARSITSTNWGDECRATSTAPAGNDAETVVVR